MSLDIGDLYHWSPKVMRTSILQFGLQVMKPCRLYAKEEPRPAFPWICFGTTPSSAWGLVLRPEEEDGKDGWDLWQATLREGDDIRVRGDFAPYIREVRVMHGISPERLWWVGERALFAHETIGIPSPPLEKKAIVRRRKSTAK